MKRKIDKNRPTLKGYLLRAMLGTALLCTLTSLSSFGQDAAASLTLDELKDLKNQINAVENKLANPLVQADATATADLQLMLASMVEKYAFHARAYDSDPAASAELSAYDAHTEEQQIVDLAIQDGQVGKIATQMQLDAEQAASSTGDPVLSPFSTPTSGYQSTDQNKVP